MAKFHLSLNTARAYNFSFNRPSLLNMGSKLNVVLANGKIMPTLTIFFLRYRFMVLFFKYQAIPGILQPTKPTPEPITGLTSHQAPSPSGAPRNDDNGSHLQKNFEVTLCAVALLCVWYLLTHFKLQFCN